MVRRWCISSGDGATLEQAPGVPDRFSVGLGAGTRTELGRCWGRTATLRTDAVKTVIAALVVTTFASILPAAAAETTPVLRRGDSAVVLPTEGKDAKAPAVIEAPPAKKIRVVLASPYGN